MGIINNNEKTLAKSKFKVIVSLEIHADANV